MLNQELFFMQMSDSCHRRLPLPEIILNEDESSHFFLLQIAVSVNALLGCRVSIKYKLRLFKALGQSNLHHSYSDKLHLHGKRGFLVLPKFFSSSSSFHIFFFLFLASHMTTFYNAKTLTTQCFCVFKSQTNQFSERAGTVLVNQC